MLKYQVRTLGRGDGAKKRRSSNPSALSYNGSSLRDVFHNNMAGFGYPERIPENDGDMSGVDDCSDSSMRNDHVTSFTRSLSTASSSTTSSINSDGMDSNDGPCNFVNPNASAGYGGSALSWRQMPATKLSQRLQARNLNARGRSTSVSSLSSTSTSSEPSVEWGHVKVYTYNIRPDTTYFTLSANTSMTCNDLIRRALDRLRMKIKDIDLFYMTMELNSKQQPQQQGVSSSSTPASASAYQRNNICQQASTPSCRDVTNVLALDPQSKPLELQMCHPAGKSKFVIQLRYTFPMKIYDYCLSNTSNYKSLLVSQRTTCADVIRSILHAHKMITYDSDQFDNFVLVFMDYKLGKEKILDLTARIFDVCLQIESDHQQIHIKPLLNTKFEAKYYGISSAKKPYFQQQRQQRSSRLDLDAITYCRLADKFREFVL